MPVVDYLVPKVGVFALEAHYFAPGPQDGVQKRPESFHLSDFVEHMCTKCFQSIPHLLGDDLHVAESLHPMTISRGGTSVSARTSTCTGARACICTSGRAGSSS